MYFTRQSIPTIQVFDCRALFLYLFARRVPRAGGRVLRFAGQPLGDAVGHRGARISGPCTNAKRPPPIVPIPMIREVCERIDYRAPSGPSVLEVVGAEAKGPVDLEVAPRLHLAGEDAERAQSRPQVCCDPRRIDAGQSGDQRGRRTHQGAGRHRHRVRGDCEQAVAQLRSSGARRGRLDSQRAVDRRRRRDSARSSTSPRRRRPCLQRSTWHWVATRRGSFDQGRNMVETGGTALPAQTASPQSTSPEFSRQAR